MAKDDGFQKSAPRQRQNKKRCKPRKIKAYSGIFGVPEGI